MARDYEDIHDLDDLSDDELRELVRSHLREHRGLDADDVSVEVEDGVVRLQGRVGTEGELRIAAHVVTDVIGPTIRELALGTPWFFIRYGQSGPHLKLPVGDLAPAPRG